MRIILIILLLNAFGLYSQPKDLTREYILAGTITSAGDTVKYKNAGVETETEFEIDANGNKINSSVSSFNKSGNADEVLYFIKGKKYTVSTFKYNEKGLLAVQNTRYSGKDSILNSRIEYKYDNSTRLESIESYLAQKLADKTVIRYDDNLNYMSITEYNAYNSNTGSIEYYFNDKNFLIKEKNNTGDDSTVTHYTYDGEVVYIYTKTHGGDTTNDTQEMKFDEHGNIVQKFAINDGHNPFVEFKAQYNSLGLPLTEAAFDSNGKESWRYTWEYDKAGNKLSEEYSFEGNFVSKIIYRYNAKGLLEASTSGGKNVDFKGKRSEYVYEYY